MIGEAVPDILLLDLFMYDMNGFEVLKEMHKDENLRSVPVIVITGLKDKNAAVRCIEAGAFEAPPTFPTFADGHREIVLCDAILESHRSERWVTIQ